MTYLEEYQPGISAGWRVCWEALVEEEREAAEARWLMAYWEPRGVGEGDGDEGQVEKVKADEVGSGGGHVGPLLGRRWENGMIEELWLCGEDEL
jgi:hypothetical protein